MSLTELENLQAYNTRLESENIHLHISIDDAHVEIKRLKKIVENTRALAFNTNMHKSLSKEILQLTKGFDNANCEET